MNAIGLTSWIEMGRMDELARMDTPVHRVDARAKAIVTLAFVVAVMSFGPYSVSALTPFLLYPIALISLGRIPAWHILNKMLLAAPFAFVIGILNPLMDRQTVSVIGPFAITGGWVSFTSIMLRFILTVGAALALIACTGMYRLGAGLERLGVPRVFVMQLLFLYRYLFLISAQGSKMLRGVELRSNGIRSLPLRTYGSLAGNLLLRSMDRADRVYRAMLARGFNGEIRLLRQPAFRWTDLAFIVGWLTFFVVARRWNLANILGAMLTGVSP